MANLIELLSENSRPIKLEGNLPPRHDVFYDECLERYRKESVNNIIEKNVGGTKIFQNPIKANRSLIKNTIFIMFLFVDNNSAYEKLKNYIYQPQKNLLNNRPIRENTNKSIHSIGELQNPRLRQDGGDKDSYRNLITQLKKEYSQEFANWFCSFYTIIRILWTDIVSIGREIINNKNYIGGANSLEEVIGNMEEPNEDEKFGEILNFVLTIGLVLYGLRIQEPDFYKKINDRKMDGKLYEKRYHEYLPENSIKELLLFILKLYVSSDLISNPVKEIYSQFNKNNSLNNCYTNILNYTFFFRYIMSLHSVTGNNKSIAKLLYTSNRKFSLRNITDANTNIGKSFLKRLESTFKQEKPLNRSQQVVSDSVFYWESSDYLILSAKVERNSIVLSSIGIDMSMENKMSGSTHNKEVATFTVSKSKSKEITIECLVEGKKDIGKMVVRYDEEDLVIEIGGNILYNIFRKDDNNYCLNRLCPKILASVSKCIVVFSKKSKNGGQVLSFITRYTVKPIELIISFIIGLLIENSEKMENIMNNISNKPISREKVKCLVDDL